MCSTKLKERENLVYFWKVDDVQLVLPPFCPPQTVLFYHASEGQCGTVPFCLPMLRWGVQLQLGTEPISSHSFRVADYHDKWLYPLLL